MNKTKIELFLQEIKDKSIFEDLEWEELNKSEIRLILENISVMYSSIVGAYALKNKKGDKKTVIGKFKMNVFYDEDSSIEQEIPFFSITETSNYSKSIVFHDSELTYKTKESIIELYRDIETDGLDQVLDDWF